MSKFYKEMYDLHLGFVFDLIDLIVFFGASVMAIMIVSALSNHTVSYTIVSFK